MSVSMQRLADELAIRNQIGRFADAAIRIDGDAMAALFTERGEFLIGEPPAHHAVGHTQIGELLRKLRQGKEFFVQMPVPLVIEIDGDRATTRTLIQEAGRGPGEAGFRCFAIFFDELVRSGDSWLFTKRHARMLWLDTAHFAGNTFQIPFDALIAPR